MLYTGLSRLRMAGLAACLSFTTLIDAASASWLDCSSHPDTLLSLNSVLQPDAEWPFGSMVLLEGFVAAVHTPEHQFSLAVRFFFCCIFLTPHDILLLPCICSFRMHRSVLSSWVQHFSFARLNCPSQFTVCNALHDALYAVLGKGILHRNTLFSTL